jgi:predicted DCC family thiol-disulfide oxidoreductase YuxK
MAKTKVYYNSACPVCYAGIKLQRRKLRGCPARVDWIDVHSDNAAAGEIGADLEFVRERLHVVDDSGEIRVGSEAFSALWKLTPHQGWLAGLSALPVIRTLFRWAYNGFAAALYRWNRRRGRW